MENTFKEFKRITKNLKRTMKYIHKKEGYLYTFLFFDIVWCYIRYGITYNEYRIFEFYNLEASKRRTYISKRKYNKLKKILVDDEITSVINDKTLFLRRFSDYITNDIYNINNMSFKQFEDYAYENVKIIARSTNSKFINSYKEYDINDYRSPAFTLEDIKSNKQELVQKSFNQYRSLNEIAPLVIINVVSVVNYNNIDLVTASIKFKDGNKIISGNINIRKNTITGHLKDRNGHNYKESFDGFEIPCFDEIKERCAILAREIEEIRQVEWSFVVGSRGIVHLIDANVWDDYVFSQTPEFLNNRIGLMSYYKKVI